MAASQRQLARLPLEIFQPFSVEGGDSDAQAIRQAVCQKLQSVPRKSPHHRAAQSTCSYEEVRSVGALLQLSVPSLVEALDPLLTYEQCHELLFRISQHCVPSPATAWSLLQSQEEDRHVLPTSLTALDRHLRGGLRSGSVTELVGSAGIGKTQWALTLVVQAALKRCRGSIYIDTEDKLSLSRLREIAQHQSCGDAARSLAVLSNVTLHSLHTTDELVSCLQSLDEQILLRNHQSKEEATTLPPDSFTSSPSAGCYPVELVVVDSVAAPLLRDYGSAGAAAAAPQRVSRALSCAQLLQRLADQCGVAVVVINQIDHHHSGRGAPPQTGTAPDPSQEWSSAPPPVWLPQASLGTAWHHCVSTRIVLQAPPVVGEGMDRGNVPLVGGGGGGPHPRTATVTKSHVVAPAGPFPYEISSRGIVDATTLPAVGELE